MTSSIAIAALYRFVRLDDYAGLRQPLLDFMLGHEIRGSLLLAAEGINGTVAGRPAAIDELLEYLRSDERLRDLDCKLSYDDEMPFNRSRVKLKREIVTMGVDDLDPAQAGTYVEPADWNRLISDPEVTLIDTRNDYESAIGSFEDSWAPNTGSFREFPGFARDHLDPSRHRKIAMYCTGGIRCEKSTAYLRRLGFDEVFHLKGGILNYLEQVPENESLWRGECFVFDNRVSVNHALEKGSYDQCHACRRPLSAADKASDRYRPGVSCPACFEERGEDERERYREREKQVHLARQRGESHIGADAAAQGRQRKSRKLAARRAQRENSRRSMKTIGVIGGMSWESSALYYRLINTGIRQQLGALHSAEMLMYSVDFAPIEAMQHAGDWSGAARSLVSAARRLEAGGADFFLIATNTMHQVADEVSAAVQIPLLHIADATAETLRENGVERVGLLGTAFTMEMDFYRRRLGEHFGIEVVVPELHDRQLVHDIIYQELCQGVVDADSREVYLAVMERMRGDAIDGIILGCTEIGMLIRQEHTEIPLYDTTSIHAQQAVSRALAED